MSRQNPAPPRGSAHVPRSTPDTWLRRTVAGLSEAIALKDRCVALYAAFAGRSEVLAGLRRQGPRVLARFAKARSTTQSPSAAERVGEDMAAAKIGGASTPELLKVGVEFTAIAHALDDRPTSPALVLEAIHESDRAEAAEHLAESALLTDAGRQLSETRLEELEERTKASIAADLAKVDLAARLRRQLRMARRSAERALHPMRGGLAS